MKAEQPSRRWPNAFRRARPPDVIRTESFCPVSGPLPYEKPVSAIAQCQCLLRSCCGAEQGPMFTEEHLGGRFAAVASFGAGEGCAAFGSQEKTVLATSQSSVSLCRGSGCRLQLFARERPLPRGCRLLLPTRFPGERVPSAALGRTSGRQRQTEGT